LKKKLSDYSCPWCKDNPREKQTFLTKHHRRCTKYSLEEDCKEIILDLLLAIESINTQNQEVHPNCLEAYNEAKKFVQQHPR